MARYFRVEHSDGTTSELPHVSSEVERAFAEQDLGTFATRRSAVNEVSLSEGDDEVYFVDDGVDEWGGVLKDVVRKGAETELVVESFERLARDAKPTGGGDLYENAPDSAIIHDAIADTPGLSAGSVSTVESALTLVFSHASQAKKMRRVEGAGAGELRYNPNKTVDYSASLGADRTATTLSPANRNVIGDIEVSRQGGSNQVTHLRMLGVGEGDAQVSTEVSVQNAPTDPADQVWDTYRDKGLSDVSALQSLGDALISEMNREHVNAELTVRGVDVALGDEFSVSVPTEGLDRAMRVVELKTVVDKDGRRHMAKFSTRQKTEADEEAKRRQDVERYNVAFEGSPVTVNTSGGRQPVTGAENYEFDVYYPGEVEYEHRVNLRVKGMPYRAYSSGGDNNPPYSTIQTTTDSSGLVTVPADDTWTTVLSTDPAPGGPTQALNFVFYVERFGDSGNVPDPEEFRWRLALDYGNQGYWSDNPGNYLTASDGVYETVTGHIPGDLGNLSQIELQLRLQTGDTSQSIDISTSWDLHYEGVHTHPPEPGLETFDGSGGNQALYPSNCDVLVNGDPMGVSLGDGAGPFEEAVDLQGALLPGRWNTIEVSSDGIGHIMSHLDIDVYRQILGNG